MKKPANRSSKNVAPSAAAGETGRISPTNRAQISTSSRRRPPTQRAAGQELVAAAVAASRRAVAPCSRFHVGAALLTKRGAMITGANVESASYGLTCCAERVALFKALSEGEREFVAIAVVARTPGGPMPCGACRQLLAEYAPRARVLVADVARPTTIREFQVRALLPNPFTKASLR